MVLLHGVGLCADVWSPQQHLLSRNHRVLSIDLPGHGGSQVLTDTRIASIKPFVEMLEGALSEFVQGPMILVGHSLGALIAVQLSRSRHLSVSGLCLLSCVYQRSAVARRAVIKRAAELTSQDAHEVTRSPLVRWFGEHPTGLARSQAHQCKVWLEHSALRGYPAAYRVFAGQAGPGRATLEALNMPVLFLTGGDDPNSTPAMSRAMAKVAPHGKAQIIEGAAHMVSMTHADSVNIALTNFCAQ